MKRSTLVEDLSWWILYPSIRRYGPIRKKEWKEGSTYRRRAGVALTGVARIRGVVRTKIVEEWRQMVG